MNLSRVLHAVLGRALTSILFMLPIIGEAASGSATHRVVHVQGDATYHDDRGGPYRVTEGLPFESGTRLVVGQGGTVLIVCAHGQPKKLNAGSHKLDCPSENAIMAAVRRNEQVLRSQRLDIPVVLAPRRTSLRATRPLLNWRVPMRAKPETVYLVRMLSGRDVLWERKHTKPPMEYPKDAPALESGATYRLEVVFARRSSLEERGSGLGFWVVPAEAGVQMDNRLQRIGALPPGASNIIKANVLASSEFRRDGSAGGLGFYAEAIALLEGSALPAAQELLSQLYLAIRLPAKCRDASARAINGYEAAGDAASALRVSEDSAQCREERQ